MNKKAFCKDYPRMKAAIEEAALAINGLSGGADAPEVEPGSFSETLYGIELEWYYYEWPTGTGTDAINGHSGPEIFRGRYTSQIWFNDENGDPDFDREGDPNDYFNCTLYSLLRPVDEFVRFAPLVIDGAEETPAVTRPFVQFDLAAVEIVRLREQLTELQSWSLDLGIVGFEEAKKAIEDLRQAFAETVKKWREH